jgi:hypothetical protein
MLILHPRTSFDYFFEDEGGHEFLVILGILIFEGVV